MPNDDPRDGFFSYPHNHGRFLYSHMGKHSRIPDLVCQNTTRMDFNDSMVECSKAVNMLLFITDVAPIVGMFFFVASLFCCMAIIVSFIVFSNHFAEDG